VTILKTGKHAIVRINDRGPFTRGRVIDVSRRAAEILGMVGADLTRVKVEIVR
jgi:rare lipoprotein A